MDARAGEFECDRPVAKPLGDLLRDRVIKAGNPRTQQRDRLRLAHFVNVYSLSFGGNLEVARREQDRASLGALQERAEVLRIPNVVDNKQAGAALKLLADVKD